MNPVEKQQLKVYKQLSPEEQAILEEMVSGNKVSKAANAGDAWEERLKAMRKWRRLCKQSGLI